MFRMNMISKPTMLLVATLALGLAASSGFAASKKAAPKPSEIVNVVLGGEADQPMTAKPDKMSVKAGLIEFDVKNDAIGTDHEMVLVKLSSADQKITADPKTHRVDEKRLKSLGEVAGLKAGETKKLTVKMTPGSYMLICNHKSHFELGMSSPFTVTP